MSTQHPTLHNKYIERIQIIEIIEEYRNKEDLHGGPGYYSKEIVLAHKEFDINPENLRNHLQPRA